MPIEKSFNHIESLINENETLSRPDKEKITTLHNQLKAELVKLSKTNYDDALSISNFLNLNLHESLRKQKQPELLETAKNSLQTAIESFEVANPILTKTVNMFLNTLSQLGI
jgi:hypothetical protein